MMSNKSFLYTLLRKYYSGKCYIECIIIVTTLLFMNPRYQYVVSIIQKSAHYINLLLVCLQNYAKQIQYRIIPTVTMYHNMIPFTSNNKKYNCQYPRPFSCQYDITFLFCSLQFIYRLELIIKVGIKKIVNI